MVHNGRRHTSLFAIVVAFQSLLRLVHGGYEDVPHYLQSFLRFVSGASWGRVSILCHRKIYMMNSLRIGLIVGSATKSYWSLYTRWFCSPWSVDIFMWCWWERSLLVNDKTLESNYYLQYIYLHSVFVIVECLCSPRHCAYLELFAVWHGYCMLRKWVVR